MTERINGIAKSGAIAYKEGVLAGDCPYPEESDDFSRWNDEWDAAADEAVMNGKAKVGSVITNRYRAQYAESGHPTHCGDELAIVLNNYCSNKAGTNLEVFEAICAANGVNLTRYNRTSKGWQGRLRMTGRNLLAKVVRARGGCLILPPSFGQSHHQLTNDWLFEADHKFKPKADR